MSDLICSPDYCNLHDWDMVIDDENGKRPRGRNPWRGFCRRIDALDRIRSTDDRDLLLRQTRAIERLVENKEDEVYVEPQRPRRYEQPAPLLPKPKRREVGYQWKL
jgi:hypothetical protein